MITHEKIICQLKFLEENSRKKSFLVNFFNKFVKKISYNMRIFSNIHNSLR